ncbi:hypothetical protein OG618_18180 [Kitasatospora sp. NBC_01246]|uniref:hypothetical protein n=1 Tax=Kitasatospora sp. NBC_01246 TaxID=2903570 RepID=UPI002E33C34F|nr:hypothetical protein [Kitasatospora sp. NBC_01246]
MPVHPALTEVPTEAQIRRTSRVISAGTWVLTGAVVAVSMSTAAPFIDAHSPGYGTGPVMAVAGDGCFILSLQADSTLSRFGVSAGRWPAVFRWVTGLATVWLNIGAAALEKDLVGVVIHLIPPLLLLLVAEAGPAYRRALARLANRPQPPLAARPARVPKAARQVVNAPLFTLPAVPFTPPPPPAGALPSGPLAGAREALPAAPVNAVNTGPVHPAPEPVHPAPADPAGPTADPVPTTAEDVVDGPVYTDEPDPVNTPEPEPFTPEQEVNADTDRVDTDPPEPERLDGAEAARVIEECWRQRVPQREAARRATRSPAYVSAVYKRLGEQDDGDAGAVAA